MSRNTRSLNEATTKANEIVEKALADPTTAESSEVLAALSDAVRELRNVAGTNPGIAELAAKVEALVAAKRQTPV